MHLPASYKILCNCWYVFFYPEDGGDTLLRNFGSHDLHGATSQKTAFFMKELIVKLMKFCF
jgi:hypothetical protein